MSHANRQHPRALRLAWAALVLGAGIGCSDASGPEDELRAGAPYISGRIEAVVTQGDAGATLLVQGPPKGSSCGGGAANIQLHAITDIRWSDGVVAFADQLTEGRSVTVWMMGPELSSCTPSVMARAITIAGSPGGR